VDFPVQPVVIQMDPDSAGGGFVREWPRPDERIERHLGYAWQWYGFAATLVAIWLVVNIRRA
jgi:surfeit locus 1 family protein